MACNDHETAAVRYDVRAVVYFVRRCGRGAWLAFLALALLTVSFTATTALPLDGRPAATSKLINILAIRQDGPPNQLLDSRFKPGWSRVAERSGAAQSSAGNGIVPTAVRVATPRPYPSTIRSDYEATDLARFHPFDARAPPQRRQ